MSAARPRGDRERKVSSVGNRRDRPDAFQPVVLAATVSRASGSSRQPVSTARVRRLIAALCTSTAQVRPTLAELRLEGVLHRPDVDRCRSRSRPSAVHESDQWARPAPCSAERCRAAARSCPNRKRRRPPSPLEKVAFHLLQSRRPSASKSRAQNTSELAGGSCLSPT